MPTPLKAAHAFDRSDTDTEPPRETVGLHVNDRVTK